MEFLKNGISIRWINTAGFEIITQRGKHILLDPFLSGQVGPFSCYPMSIDEIQQCDYLLLSHVHFDHAGDVGAIQRKFPDLRLFVGDLSADALCRDQSLNCGRIYRVRPGAVIQFDDLKIEVFAGRHTESPRGYYREKTLKKDGSFDAMMWYGNLELQNYLLTLADGTRILVWAGMTSEDQMYAFQGMNPDIALMHVSPKQSFPEFARLVKSIRPKVVIPHHYDITEVLFAAQPDMLKDTPQAQRERFTADGIFSFPKYMSALEEVCRQAVPEMNLLTLDHHKWYRFGFCWDGQR